MLPFSGVGVGDGAGVGVGEGLGVGTGVFVAATFCCSAFVGLLVFAKAATKGGLADGAVFLSSLGLKAKLKRTMAAKDSRIHGHNDLLLGGSLFRMAYVPVAGLNPLPGRCLTILPSSPSA